ncbi:MAG TPA: nucleoside 2-deoxyribosyltransferase [Anaerolineales bacterium]|nr:nucleoside 2-deoxyribosyltransferase [Anaerolineales bacterium]
MNIYFACSITGGRQDEAVYQELVAALLADGHQVPTALLAGSDVVALEHITAADDIYRRDTEWIRGCDLLVAEISTPSHGVGYEIGYALGLGKPVLCLHRQGVKISKMITGNPAPHLSVLAYETAEEAVRLLKAHLQKA